MDTIRLNKFISAAGYCSRRKADELISNGKVFVNGKKADMGMRIQNCDEVTVGGEIIRNENPFKLVVFYKPRGYACTAHHGDKSSIFNNFNLSSDLKYIGRLDKDSEGILLLTNDGDLCNEISKSRNQHEKEYVVTVDHPVTVDFINEMQKGVEIFNPNKNIMVKTNPCKIRKLKNNIFDIILTQGLNRQIRKMCENFGYKVIKLKRIRVMNIDGTDMHPGDIRFATDEELKELKRRISLNKN